jgi:hypothetical protein
MEQIISNGLIEKIEGKNYIKFDLGKNYYLGEINDNIFEDSKLQFLDNKSIIEKSFVNYSTNNFKISGNFEHDDITIDNKYIINIKIISDIINFSQNYIIDMRCHKKDKVDYLEEEFNKLKKRLEELELTTRNSRILQIKKVDYDSDELVSESETSEEEQKKVVKRPVISSKLKR